MNKTITYLIAVVALMITSMGASAQNTGLTPYANSTHVYTSTKSAIASTTMSWAVSGGVIQGALDGLSVTILWGNIAGTHILSVTELTPSGCTTVRNLSVDLKANSYNLAVSPPSEGCAMGSGTIIADAALRPGNTTVVYTVTCTGDNTKTSTFDYALTTTSSAVISSVIISGGIYNGTLLTGNDMIIPIGTNSFTVTIVIDSKFDIQDVVKLAITDGKAAYATTENNILDNDGTATINAVPKTSSILTD